VIVDARVNFGWYIDKGMPAVPMINDNFIRLGARVRGAVEFTGITGYYRRVFNLYRFLLHSPAPTTAWEMQGSLIFNFGENKLFGLTASYRNGRWEDNARRDQAWTMSLTVIDEPTWLPMRRRGQRLEVARSHIQFQPRRYPASLRP
jgi:hypothetical protein